MGKRGDYVFICLMIIILLVAVVLSANFVSSQTDQVTPADKTTQSNVWKYKNKTLTEILNDNKFSNTVKLIAIEKAFFDKALTESDLDLAVSKKIITEQDKAGYLKDLGLWDFIKAKTGYYWLFVNQGAQSSVTSFKNGVGWLVGYNTFEGDSMHLFSANYWTTNGWKYALGSFVTGLIILIFMTGDLTLGFINRADNSNDLKSVYSTTIFIALPLLVLFPVLMGIPVLNRFLQLITFELLGLNWLWRCLIFAAILFFGPVFLARYRAYRRRTQKYKSALRDIAVKEIEKVHLGSS